jgi:hypothetical protein
MERIAKRWISEPAFDAADKERPSAIGSTCDVPAFVGRSGIARLVCVYDAVAAGMRVAKARLDPYAAVADHRMGGAVADVHAAAALVTAGFAKTRELVDCAIAVVIDTVGADLIERFALLAPRRFFTRCRRITVRIVAEPVIRRAPLRTATGTPNARAHG